MKQYKRHSKAHIKRDISFRKISDFANIALKFALQSGFFVFIDEKNDGEYTFMLPRT